MSPTRRRETILVVDDEQMVLGLVNSMLTRFGYRVIAAASGKEALDLLEKKPDIEVQLALVDLVLPGMTGVEFVEQIHQVRPGLPVLYFRPIAKTIRFVQSSPEEFRLLRSRSHRCN
jgi:CheY-like chemotaxis protein